MPVTTATGRVVKEIIDDPQFKAMRGAKTKFCQVVETRMNDTANQLIQKLSRGDYQGAYALFTDARKLIEIKELACK